MHQVKFTVGTEKTQFRKSQIIENNEYFYQKSFKSKIFD